MGWRTNARHIFLAATIGLTVILFLRSIRSEGHHVSPDFSRALAHLGKDIDKSLDVTELQAYALADAKNASLRDSDREKMAEQLRLARASVAGLPIKRPNDERARDELLEILDAQTALVEKSGTEPRTKLAEELKKTFQLTQTFHDKWKEEGK